MKTSFIIAVFSFSYFIISSGCSSGHTGHKQIDRQWLDSIVKASDTSYTKNYYRTDFVKAEYIINKKDATVCQIMRDSANNIMQISVTRKDIRILFAQYYKSGRLKSDAGFDNKGQFHGITTDYFEDGRVQKTGSYRHGLKVGEWNYFDVNGHLISKEQYNDNGEVISSAK